MKRPNGAGQVIKLTGKRRRSFAVRITKWDEKTKRRKYIYLGYYVTYQEAELALSLYRVNPIEKPEITFGELYAEWSAMKYGKRTKATADNYRAAWNYLKPLEVTKVRNLRTAHIQRIVDHAEYRPASKKGEPLKPLQPCSRSSLEKIRGLAVLLMDYAVQQDIVDKNYASFVELPRVHKTEKECFSDLEVQKIKAAADTGDVGCQEVYIMICSGFRISEFLSLDRFTVDTEKLTFRAGEKTEAGYNRVVPIHPACVSFVKSLLQINGQAMVCKDDGSLMSVDYFRKYVYYPALERASVRRLVPHATRHTFASRAAKVGVPTNEIQKLLGHAKYSFTADTYTHVDLESLSAAVAAI